MNNKLVTIIALSLALGGLAACGDDDADDSANGAAGGEASGVLTIYSGRDAALIGPVLDDFTEETGIDVQLRPGGSADLALLIEQEGDRSPADVFISQSPGAVGFLAERGRLEQIPEDILDEVSPGFRGDDGEWVGITGRVRTLVYNTELVDEADLPESVFEVTEERFRDQVGVAPTNSSFQDFVSVMREEVGDDETLDWLEALESNGAVTYANNSSIVEAVGRGEVAYGLVNHYYNERVKVDDPAAVSENHLFEAGDVGSTILVTAAAIVEGTDRREEAEAFLEFLLSTDAQEFFAEETLEYPLAAGVLPATELPLLEAITPPPTDFAALGRDLEATKELIERSGLEQA